MKKIRFEDIENLEHVIEVCRQKNKKIIDDTWSNIVKKLNLPVKPEALSRFAKYIGIYEDYLEDNDLEGTQEKLLEIKKERIKLSDERRELNRVVRELARMEKTQESLLEIWDNEPEVAIFEEGRRGETFTGKNREGVIIISDVHYGIVVDNEVNKYDPEECIKDFEKLYNVAIENIYRYNLKKYHILLAGDLVSGIIHTNLRLQQGEDIIKQIKGVSSILGSFITNLNKVIEVDVRYTIGNHSRVVADKKQSLSSENFEHLIAWYLNAKTDANIVDNDTDISLFDVCGYKVASLHGHQVAPAASYEYVVKRTKNIPDYIFIAHYHNDGRIDKGCPIITNGSMVGVDEYALEKGYNSIAHQKIVIFEEDEGEIATIKVNFNRR